MQFFSLVKQSGLNDMPIKFYLKKNENNLDYEKMPLKMGLEHSGKVSWFWLKLVYCFQRPLKNSLYTSQRCSRYLKGTPDSNRYVSKKIRVARHTNKKI